ncbi:MAG: Hsp20/alpha crystallin family protein [Christensenellales bacterium]|jgi:HSP20 family protein
MSGLIPFNGKSLFNRDFSIMLDDFFGDFLPGTFIRGNAFKVDVSETDNGYLVEAELPGVKKEDINIDLIEGRLTISVTGQDVKEEKKSNYIHKERRYGAMMRSIYLPDVTREGVDAEFGNGLLKINIPKSGKDDKSYKIDIK